PSPLSPFHRLASNRSPCVCAPWGFICRRLPSPSASRRPLGSSGRFEEALARIEELRERDTGADDSSTASSFLSDGEAASRLAGKQQSHSADFLSDGEAASGGIQRRA
uniref:Uncharacterized protein n=1 Tax=Zea mays TaxID=4577 RepID=A0A804NKN7_MAIZE